MQLTPQHAQTSVPVTLCPKTGLAQAHTQKPYDDKLSLQCSVPPTKHNTTHYTTRCNTTHTSPCFTLNCKMLKTSGQSGAVSANGARCECLLIQMKLAVIHTHHRFKLPTRTLITKTEAEKHAVCASLRPRSATQVCGTTPTTCPQFYLSKRLITHQLHQHPC